MTNGKMYADTNEKNIRIWEDDREAKEILAEYIELAYVEADENEKTTV